MLGKQWDIRPVESHVMFVTQFCIGLSRCSMLNCSVSIACYRGELTLDEQYRLVLLQNILEGQIGDPDETEDEDLEVGDNI